MVINYSKTTNTYTIPESYPIPRIDEMVNQIHENEVFSTFDLVSANHQVKLPESDLKYTTFEVGRQIVSLQGLVVQFNKCCCIFSVLMDQIVEQHYLKGNFINMDNITTAGKSQKKHDENVMK